MPEPEVDIRLGLAAEHRAAAIETFEAAFGEKFARALPDVEGRRAFLEATLAADRCLVASDGELLLGLAGLKAAGGRFRGGAIDADTLGFRELRRMLGPVGAIRATLMLGFLDHQAEPGELYIDFIAVAPAARGRGVGTRLLDGVAAIGREDGFRCVRLDVIDTNPRAQALYEREGYRVVEEQRLYFLSRFAGFSSSNVMELALDGSVDAPAGPA